MRTVWSFKLKLLGNAFLLTLLLAGGVMAQDDDDWPSLSYLRSDYKTVVVVAHIRVQHAEISARIPGLESWTIAGEVLEPFKGKFKKGDAIQYFEGAEAGLVKETHFIGEKIVFLLAEPDRDGKIRYSALENSSLPYTEQRVRKLRLIKRSYQSKRKRKSHNHSSTSATTFAR